ncbi:acyltransferase family protein [Butyrivibrio proteoclasticus]|nr:acyltransferase family protein [Butyrivibrio proteoclasticus]
MMKRNSFIDCLRGFAIILVVVGHAIQFATDNYDEIWIYKAIYSFHMPLFMFISGITISNKQNEWGKWIVRKAKALIIPFVVWLIIPWVFKRNWSGFLHYLLEVFWDPTITYWFLISLFFNHAVYALSRSFFKVKSDVITLKIVMIDMAIVALASVLNLIHLPLGIANISYYYFFYIIGYYVNQFQIVSKVNKITYKIIVLVFSGGIWLLLLSMWKRGGCVNVMADNSNTQILSSVMTMIAGRGVSYLNALFGIMMLVSMTDILMHFIPTKYTEYVGRNTMEIYLLHFYFINMINIGVFAVEIVLGVVTGILIPLCISRIVRNDEFGRLLFGR